MAHRGNQIRARGKELIATTNPQISEGSDFVVRLLPDPADPEGVHLLVENKDARVLVTELEAGRVLRISFPLEGQEINISNGDPKPL